MVMGTRILAGEIRVLRSNKKQVTRNERRNVLIQGSPEILLINAAGEEASVDDEDFAGYEGGGVAGEVDGRAY